MIQTRTIVYGVMVFHDVGSVVIAVGGLGGHSQAAETLTAGQARELAAELITAADGADRYVNSTREAGS